MLFPKWIRTGINVNIVEHKIVRNGVYIGPITKLELLKLSYLNVHTNLKWIFEVSKGKKTGWPISQRLIDVSGEWISQNQLTASLELQKARLCIAVCKLEAVFTCDCLMNFELTQDIIASKLIELKVNIAPGVDGIVPRILFENADILRHTSIVYL